MIYTKAEATAIPAIKATQSRNFKLIPIIFDSLGMVFPRVTSAAYEADE